VSDTRIDFVIVTVNRLDPSTPGHPPPRHARERGGDILRVGRIAELDADGVADLIRQFDDRDLSGFTEVQVQRPRGRGAVGVHRPDAADARTLNPVGVSRGPGSG
jgi:hypothetical protein